MPAGHKPAGIFSPDGGRCCRAQTALSGCADLLKCRTLGVVVHEAGDSPRPTKRDNPRLGNTLIGGARGVP